jgi:asparagine synthase (glutamine-hydrolysing)
MCRIVAVIDRRGAQARDPHGLIEKMRDTMQAGGPDDAGQAFFAQQTVALGHRRLSVIELSPLGHQPMASADQRYHMVFNGEIYNHAQLREELIALGHSFRSHSDTEVILAAYSQWGKAAFKRFRGMWAFALWDDQAQELLLCRDRLGVKPLYWYHQGGLTLIASELKALYAHPDLPRRINPTGMRLFFQYNYIPFPHSICLGVEKLAPGTWLTINRHGAVTRDAYWRLQDAASRPPTTMDEREVADELERRLREAFRYRMVSDVPVGLFLSGGVDSSLLLALLAKESASKLKTFTIGFAGTGLDEAPYARAIAAALGSEHYEMNQEVDAALAIVSKIPDVWDEPFGDASAIPTWLVAQFARKHVTVALSADGGDELFGGYPKYWRSQERARRLTKKWGIDRLRAQLPQALINHLGRRYGIGVNKLLKSKEILQSNNSLAHAAFVIGQQTFIDSDMDQLLLKPAATGNTSFDHWNEFPLDDLNRMMAIDLQTYHVDDIHVKVDRATMAHGLEGREPLVDHELVEFAQTIPSAMKIRGGIGKQVLRQVLYRHVDRALIDRPKMGFSPPLDRWLAKDMAPLVESCLNEQRIKEAGIFNVKAIAEVRQSFARRANDNTQKLWNLVIFEQWRQRWNFSL